MNELFKTLSELMAIKQRVVNIYVDNYENKRECPFYSELRGIEETLKHMGIDFEYEFDNELNIVSVSVMGYKTTI